MHPSLIIPSDETIIWESSPEYKPFLMSALVGFLNAVRFFVFSWSIFIVPSILLKYELNWTTMYVIAATLLGDGLIRSIWKILNYKKTRYFISSRKIYIQTGVFTPQVKTFERKKIVHIDVTESKFEKKYDAATILIYFGETKMNDDKEEKIFRKFEAVKSPANVIRLLP